jgi:hypothetical protein
VDGARKKNHRTRRNGVGWDSFATGSAPAERNKNPALPVRNGGQRRAIHGEKPKPPSLCFTNLAPVRSSLSLSLSRFPGFYCAGICRASAPRRAAPRLFLVVLEFLPAKTSAKRGGWVRSVVGRWLSVTCVRVSNLVVVAPRCVPDVSPYERERTPAQPSPFPPLQRPTVRFSIPSVHSRVATVMVQNGRVKPVVLFHGTVFLRPPTPALGSWSHPRRPSKRCRSPFTFSRADVRATSWAFPNSARFPLSARTLFSSDADRRPADFRYNKKKARASDNQGQQRRLA